VSVGSVIVSAGEDVAKRLRDKPQLKARKKRMIKADESLRKFNYDSSISRFRSLHVFDLHA